MKLRWRHDWIWPGLCVLGLLLVAAVGPAGAQGGDGGQTIRGFEVPEFDRDNRLRSMLFGEFARLLPTGVVDITKMRIDFFNDQREVEMRLTADTCLYDRTTSNAESDGRVRMARANMIVTGEGFNWNAEDGVFQIFDDAKVVLSGVGRLVDRATKGENL